MADDPLPLPLPLRDELAIDRTVMANERTLLAYARTALALLVTGAGAVRLFAEPSIVAIGWTFIVLAVLSAALGFVRFARMRRKIEGTRGGQ